MDDLRVHRFLHTLSNSKSLDIYLLKETYFVPWRGPGGGEMVKLKQNPRPDVIAIYTVKQMREMFRAPSYVWARVISIWMARPI